MRIVATSVTHETDRLIDRLVQQVGQTPPRILQIGAKAALSDRNERNWRGLIDRRFNSRMQFVGMDLAVGPNVDRVIDICAPLGRLRAALGDEPFDLVICCHVLEHTKAPSRAARNIQTLLKPGGLVFVATPWSQAFHAAPDDYWRFSMRGLGLLFSRLEILSAFYSGGDVGLDVAYRVERDGAPELDVVAGAIEQGLFQVVLDHEDNRDVLGRQATERLPVSRTYLPTLFVNVIGQRRT